MYYVKNSNFEHEYRLARVDEIPEPWDGASYQLDCSEFDVATEYPQTPIKHGCEDHWTWNRRERSVEVRLYGQGQRIAHFHPNWSSGTAGVRGTRILNNGRYFWELQISRRIFGTSMMFGVGTKKARLHADSFTNLLGEDDNGWGLSHKGLLWHDGRWRHYTKPFRENVSTRIGILFDGIAGTLTYYQDGVCLGVAFKGLNEVKEPLYPVICSTAAKTEMRLNFTKRDFVNLQDRCRAVIIGRVKDKKDLEKLFVPPRIRGYLAEAIVENAQPFKPVNDNVEANSSSIGTMRRRFQFRRLPPFDGVSSC